MMKEGFPRCELNKIIHEPARLLILTFLASSPDKESTFTEVRDHLQMSGGNLSIQLKNLQEAGFIKVGKKFEENKPLTTVTITAYGVDTLIDYFDEMEKLILAVKQEQLKNDITPVEL